MTEVSFKKAGASIKNLRKAQRETDRLLKKTFLEADKRFKETEQALKASALEADKRFKETERTLKANALEADKRFKETERALKASALETERTLKANALEADKRFKETERALKASALETERALKASALGNERVTKATNDSINKLDGEFTSRWGKLVESLVSGDLVKLLKKWNIDVENIYERYRGMWQNKQFEFDIIAKNGTDIVVTEVKTTMKVKDVNHFLSRLKDFRYMQSGCENKNIYGAMAYLRVDERANVYAERQGLFVIKATGSSASIINRKAFKPNPF